MTLFLFLLLLLLCLPLYGAVSARTLYDRQCDDAMQVLFLQSYSQKH